VSPMPNNEPANKSGTMTALVAGALIVLFGANIFLYVQINSLESDLAKVRDSISTESTALGSLRESSSAATASHNENIDRLKKELADAQTQARSLSSQAKADATAHAEQLAKQLQEEQAKARQQITTEISGVRQAAETANTKIADVSTDVGSVKTQVAATSAELQKTIADLKSVRGDLGVQSGLIATNGNELAALRRLGERNYIEFTIRKTKDRQRVGDITLLLKKTDQKKNKYTVEVMADDKLTEKKDKNINEPVQFYTSKARQPYELVVNQVQKDAIVGYLSTPKEVSGR
jgi:chromosome segregation ATPase